MTSSAKGATPTQIDAAIDDQIAAAGKPVAR